MISSLRILEALGWSLADSLWETAILWIAYLLITHGNPRMPAAGKHNLALACLVAALAWFSYSILHRIQATGTPESGFIPAGELSRWMPFVSGLYLTVLLFRTLQYIIHSWRQPNPRLGRTAHTGLEHFISSQALRAGIQKKVRVFLSVRAVTAETFGFLKPMILLPVCIVNRLTPGELESILIHELLHIRRNDFLTNIFVLIVRNLLFFNPFAVLFCKSVAREREHACDDGVIAMGYPPSVYAEALYRLEKFRQIAPGLSLAADGRRPWLLMERVRRLLGIPEPTRNSSVSVPWLWAVLAICLFGIQARPTLPSGIPATTIRASAVVPARYTVWKKAPTPSRKKLPAVAVNISSLVKPVPPVMLVIESDTVLINKARPLEQTDFAGIRMPSSDSDQSVAKSFARWPEINERSSLHFSDDEPPVISPDSPMEKTIENRIRQIIARSHLQIVENLRVLQEALEKNRRQLHAWEKDGLFRNRVQGDKKSSPDAEKIKQEIKAMQLKIDQLHIQLQLSDEEIIHI